MAFTAWPERNAAYLIAEAKRAERERIVEYLRSEAKAQYEWSAHRAGALNAAADAIAARGEKGNPSVDHGKE